MTIKRCGSKMLFLNYRFVRLKYEHKMGPDTATKLQIIQPSFNACNFDTNITEHKDKLCNFNHKQNNTFKP